MTEGSAAVQPARRSAGRQQKLVISKDVPGGTRYHLADRIECDNLRAEAKLDSLIDRPPDGVHSLPLPEAL